MQANSIVLTVLLFPLLNACLVVAKTPSPEFQARMAALDEEIARLEEEEAKKAEPIRIPENAREVFLTCTVEVDPYRKTVGVSGVGWESGGCLAVLLCTASAEDSFVILVNRVHEEPIGFHETGVDITGRELRFSPLGTERKRGMACEAAATKTTREYLESHVASGLDFRLYGERGHVDIKVPGYYVVGFLNRVDAEAGKDHFGEN